MRCSLLFSSRENAGVLSVMLISQFDRSVLDEYAVPDDKCIISLMILELLELHSAEHLVTIIAFEALNQYPLST